MKKRVVRLLLMSVTILALAPNFGRADTVYVDFTHSIVANAASWGKPSGSVSFPSSLVDVTSLVTEMGTSSEVLATTIDTNDAGFLEGLYTVAVPNFLQPGERLKFRANVGLRASAAASDGMTFQLVLVDGSKRYTLTEVEAQRDGQLTYMSADLMPFRGETITLGLRVEPGVGATADEGIWENAELAGVDQPSGLEVMLDLGDVADNIRTVAWRTGYDDANPEIVFDASSDPVGYAEPTSNGFVMRPNQASIGEPANFISGTFENLYIPSNACDVRFEAEVDFHEMHTGEATCVVEVLRDVSEPGQSPAAIQYAVGAAASVTIAHDDSATNIGINLSGWQGEWILLRLRVEAGSGPNDVVVAWIDPRIEIRSPELIFAGPPSGTDDTVLFQDAVDDASTLTASEIRLEEGTYFLHDTIDIAELANLNLVGYEHGAGTDLSIAQIEFPVFKMKEAVNIAFRGFTVDYDPLPFTQGSVDNVVGDTFEWTRDTAYPPLTVFTLPAEFGKGIPGQQGHPREGASPQNIPFGGPPSHFINSSSEVRLNVYQIEVANPTGLADAENWTCTVKQANIFQATECHEHVIVDHVTIHSAAGLPFIAKGVGKAFMRDSQVMPPPAMPPANMTRLVAASGTAVHTIGCKFGSEIMRCEFEYVMDDICNNRALSLEVVDFDMTNDPVVTIEEKHRGFVLEEVVIAFNLTQGTLGNFATVDEILSTINDEQMVRLDANPLPAGSTLQDEIFLYSETWSSKYALFHGNTARNGRGAVNINGQDCVISSNTLEGLNKAGILHDNGNMDGLLGSGLVIQNNKVTGCGYRSSLAVAERPTDGLIFVGAVRSIDPAQGGLFAPAEDRFFKDIRIVGNELEDFARHAIVVYSCDGVIIEDNTSTNTAGYFDNGGSWAVDDGWRGIVFLDNCRDVVFANNTLSDGRPQADIDGELLVRQMEVTDGDIVLSGNSFTTNALIKGLAGINELDFTSAASQLPPVAGFTASSAGPPLYKVSFTNTSENLETSPLFPNSFHWDFGDGATSSRESPNHRYEEAGDYEVRLRVETENFFDTVVISVTVE